MAAPNLAAKLRPASFRGVAFHIDVGDIEAGRRVQVHEYPQRDKPYTEDLGRSARDLTVDGFVVGENYVDQVNALLTALEKPGPGTLVHPWLGSMTVSLNGKARVSFDSGLGQARVSMPFVESGELEFPSAGAATQSLSRIAASNLESASVSSFASLFSIDGFQDFVQTSANGGLGDMFGIVSSSEVGKVLGYANKLSGGLTSVLSLVSNPSALGWKIMGLFGLSGVATSAASWTNVVRSLSRVGRSSTMSSPPAPSNYTPSRQQVYTNSSAINAIGRQALLVQAVGASSLIGTAVDTGSISYDDMVAARTELIAAIDQESLTASDGVYDALVVARNAVWADLSARSRDQARLDTIRPPDVLPALVIAYDYYEAADRDSEIITRNDIRHPGFVPADPLKVLTR